MVRSYLLNNFRSALFYHRSLLFCFSLLPFLDNLPNPPNSKDGHGQRHRNHPIYPETGADNLVVRCCVSVEHRHCKKRGYKGSRQEDHSDHRNRFHRRRISLANDSGHTAYLIVETFL
jgi:hypothetical protein